LSELRRPNIGSRYTVPFRIKPRFGQVSKNLAESAPAICGKESGHIFHQYQSGPNFANNSDELGPEPAGVGCSFSFSGDADGRAREAATDDIHASAPRLSVEGFNVVPDGSFVQSAVAHPGHEDALGVGV
jgi:hypothetical protein